MPNNDLDFRRTVKFVAIANLLYFFIEFWLGTKGSSISLFADSIDFFEDASVNFLILLVLGWSLKARVRVAKILVLVLLVPSLAAVWSILNKVQSGTVPSPLILTITGLGALIVNSVCAIKLARFRNNKSSLIKAAYLSARNDMIANIAIILAGAVTFYTGSYWADLVVGVGIVFMNADAAREVLQAARQEGIAVQP